MELLVEGHPNKIIADMLDMSAHTVKFHVRNITRKLRAGSRTGAAAAYIKHHWRPRCAACTALYPP